MEFCYTSGDLAEAFEAYIKKTGQIGEELADVVIYLLGLAEILGIDLEEEIRRKVAINARRQYVREDGVLHRMDAEPDV